MSRKKFTVDHFIEKFSAIPEQDWAMGEFGELKGPKCALGHCYHYSYTGFSPTAESVALSRMVRQFFVNKGVSDTRLFTTVEGVNDGMCDLYQQATPKQRILALLNDIKASQTPHYKDITSKLAEVAVNQKTDCPDKVMQTANI